MVDRIKVWPAAGVTVRDEYTGAAIEPGAEVPLTRLTHRRIVRGELLEEPPRDAVAAGDRDPRREPRTPDGTHAERFDKGDE